MTHKRILSIIFICFGVLAWPAYAAAYTAYTTGNVNIRTGPGTGYAKVATLAPGLRVDVLACEGSWCRVGYQGLRGWLSVNYIDRAVSTRPPAVVIQPTIVVRPPYRPPYYRPPAYRPPPPYYRPRPNCRIAPGYPCP
ncbi:SH3 domain-containing protein [Phyllobacterium sp. BT25]|uniref:SH3 domain-containing protein n=1 Tax=Phyllobacterium pellucidum TaxID=2740464 RepID=A0A849VUC4_9HYPH|nr:SH3 domain-containing protein [Phyllobacterium pellucidum]NTS33595.1 SH3 domain-containing protein [Phyllobacterium pellucidum]